MTTKKYLIFGATGGMGSAIARSLVQDGHLVHLVARDPNAVTSLATDLNATYSLCDVTDHDQVRRSVAEAGSSIDGLVYAVGSIVLKPLKATTPEALQNALATNATGALIAIQAAEHALRAANGSVLLFSTVAVGQGFANHGIVSMVKGAVEGLTRALAAELAPKVRVNAIAPSLSDTAMAAPLLANDAMRASLAKVHPLGRLGDPSDVVGLSRVLLGDQGSWITGQIIGVDGGRGALAGRG